MSTPLVSVRRLDHAGLADAQAAVTRWHYLRRRVDPRATPEAFGVYLSWKVKPLGYLICGRPEASRCYPWYGSVEDVAAGRAECTRWEVLNVARVWLSPQVQRGRGVGFYSGPNLVPGYYDRRGVWRSTLASEALRALAGVVSAGYLTARPPCFLDEPFELRYLMSYCDTQLHRGTIYAAAGWELYRTGGGESGTIQTYRAPVAPLSADERAAVVDASRRDGRAIQHRARRAQTSLAFDSNEL